MSPGPLICGGRVRASRQQGESDAPRRGFEQAESTRTEASGARQSHIPGAAWCPTPRERCYAARLVITIVDYNAGNLRSVKRACDAVGADSELSRDPEVVARAERIIFPGVGQAKSAMQTLDQTGLGEALKLAFQRGTPILGICLGSQIILDRSEEGDVQCWGSFRAHPPLRAGGSFAQGPSHRVERSARRPSASPGLGHRRRRASFTSFIRTSPIPSSRTRAYASSEHGGRFCCALGDRKPLRDAIPPRKERTGLAWRSSIASPAGTAHAEQAGHSVPRRARRQAGQERQVRRHQGHRRSGRQGQRVLRRRARRARLYDITASSENRSIMLDVVDKVASQVFIPSRWAGGYARSKTRRACGSRARRKSTSTAPR